MLVHQYTQGNDSAFDELLNRYKSKVFQYIYHCVKKQETAEDIFQDVFVKVIMNLNNGGYTENGKFISWIMRIAHNQVLDYFRSTKNYQFIVSTDDEEEKDPFNDKSIAINENMEQTMIDQQTLTDAEFLLTLLPENQREVFRMRIYEDLSFKEIAEKTGVSINTALGRMHYATQNLRKLAAEYGMTA